MAKKKYRIFYLSSLGLLLALSAYPLYMGIKVISQFLHRGSVVATDYPKYVIPYTPVCLALLLVAAIFPLLYDRMKKWSLAIGSIFGAAVFFTTEIAFENILVTGENGTMPLQSCQYLQCYATPEVIWTIGSPMNAADNPAFKMHFYLIALVIVLAVIGLLHGYTRMIREEDSARKRPLAAQTVCVAVFVGLCVLACFTAFYRNGTLYISPLSSWLTSLFFVVFGITFGVYVGSILYGRRTLLSIILPAAGAALITVAMYAGELILMGGVLFRFGSGFFFDPLGSLPFAPCDLLIIALPGMLAGILLRRLNPIEKPAPASC